MIDEADSIKFIQMDRLPYGAIQIIAKPLPGILETVAKFNRKGVELVTGLEDTIIYTFKCGDFQIKLIYDAATGMHNGRGRFFVWGSAGYCKKMPDVLRYLPNIFEATPELLEDIEILATEAEMSCL